MSAGVEQQGQACVVLGAGLRRGWPAERALRLAAAGSLDADLRDGLLRAAARSAAGEPFADAIAGAGLPAAVREAAAAIRVGADGGRGAGELLRALGEATVDTSRMLRQLVVSLTYPLIVVATTAVAGAFVVHHVLPLVAAWQTEALAAAPPPSALEGWLRALFGWPGAAFVAVVALLVASVARGTGLGWRALVLPPLVATTRAGALRALSVLLDAGVSLDESLERLAKAVVARPLRRALRRARALAAQGDSPTESLVAAGLVPVAWAGPLHAAETTDDGGWGRALGGVGRALALEGRLAAARHRVWILTAATLFAGGLVFCVGLALFGGMQWSS